jgi:hypothetical protein
MSSADRAAALAMAAGAGRGGNAIASLLSEINPFMDDLRALSFSFSLSLSPPLPRLTQVFLPVDSTQPNVALGSHAFNDDFGLSMDGLAGLEWMAAPGVAGGGIEGGLEFVGNGFGAGGGGGWP